LGKELILFGVLGFFLDDVPEILRFALGDSERLRTIHGGRRNTVVAVLLPPVLG